MTAPIFDTGSNSEVSCHSSPSSCATLNLRSNHLKLTHKHLLYFKTASPASVKSVSARRGAFEKCCPNYDDISDFTAQEMSQLTEELHLTKSQSFLEVGGGLVALYVAFNSNVGEVHGYEFSLQRHKALAKWLNELHLYRSLYHLAPHATELSKLKDFDVHSAAANVIFCNTAAIAKDVFSSVAEQLSDLMTPENILVLTTDPWTRATRSSPPPFKLYKIKTLDSGLEDVTSETTIYFFQHPDGTRPSELVQVEEVAEEAQRKTHLHATTPSRPKPTSPSKSSKSAASPTKGTSPKATAAKTETTSTSTPKRRRNTEIFPSTKTEEAVASPRVRIPARRSMAPTATTEAVEAPASTPKRVRAPASPSKASPAPRIRTPAAKADPKPSTPAGRSRVHPVAETKMDEDPAPMRSPRARRAPVEAPAAEAEVPVKSPTKKRRASVAAPPSASMEVDEPVTPAKRVRAVKAKVEDGASTSTPKKAPRTSPAAKAATEVKKKSTASRAPVAIDDIDLPAPTNRRKRTRIETTPEDSTSSASPVEANGVKPPKREAANNARESMKAVSHYIETDDEDDFERPKKKVVRSPIKSSKTAVVAAAPEAPKEAPSAPASTTKARRAPKRAGTSASTPARTSRAKGFTLPAPTSAPVEAPNQGWFGWLWNWIPGTSSASN